MRTVALALVSFAIAASASAVDTPKKEFPRAMTVKLLGYDPEVSVANECEKRANSARIMRVALVKPKPAVERVQTYLVVAGFFGIADAICPKAAAPEPLEAFTKAKEKLDEAACKAAGEALIGKIKTALDDMAVKDHPDIMAGYAEGIASRLPPLAEACYDHTDTWARLQAQAMIIKGRADSTRELKSCTLWRRAYYAELQKANDVGEAKGRVAGLAYLKGKPMFALAGSRALCTDEVGRAFEMSNYKLSEMMIGALPVTPEKSKAK